MVTSGHDRFFISVNTLRQYKMLSKNSKYYFVFLLLLRGGLLSSIDVATGILKVDAKK